MVAMTPKKQQRDAVNGNASNRAPTNMSLLAKKKDMIGMMLKTRNALVM